MGTGFCFYNSILTMKAKLSLGGFGKHLTGLKLARESTSHLDVGSWEFFFVNEVDNPV